MHHAVPEAVLESLMEVAHWPQLLLNPALLNFLLKGAELRGGEVAAAHRLKRRLRRQHPALDCQMNSLQPLRIQESGRVAKNHPAIAGNRRNGPPSAIGQRLCSIADHFAAVEHLAHERMLLEVLQYMLWVNTRVGIIEAGDEAERNGIVFRSINPRAAIFL